MDKVILLFDMDGVLIRSKGYYTSLISSVELIGRALGIKEAELSMDEISKLEAIGVFHIWDHLTFFSSILLLHSWKGSPELRLPTDFNSPGAKDLIIPEISFRDYIEKILPDRFYSTGELSDLIGDYSHGLDSSQEDYLSWFINSSREIYVSPVLPIMQEFILGSDQFIQTYDLPSQLEVKSYPEELDQPALSNENYANLQKWLMAENHHAAIFTSRPNLPPDQEYFGTPEAEIGAKITNLESLPIIGAGSLDWMADQNQVPPRSYNKPHPVHALAAMQAALGRDIKTSLENAAKITSQPRDSLARSDWEEFDKATIYVFEDSRGGMVSAQNAARILSEVGISIELKLIGIGYQADKTEALLDISDQVYKDINFSPLIDLITED